MNSLRKLIREVIEEGAAGFMSVNQNTGLVIEHGNKRIILSLFDFSKKECIGTITLKNVSDRAWYIDTVAAEYGFGPLMYELAMMAVYPAGICVGGPTNEKAFSIFDKFSSLRGDIRKVKINPVDSEYNVSYQSDEKKDYLSNLIFMRTKSIWFDKLLSRGEMLLKKTSMRNSDINDLSKEYFLGKYQNK